jgi:hypothetical protein
MSNFACYYCKLDDNRQVVPAKPEEVGVWLTDISGRRVGYDDIGPVLISTIFTPLPGFYSKDGELEMRYFETLIRGRWLTAETRETMGTVLHLTWAEAEDFHTRLVGYVKSRMPSADPNPKLRTLTQLLIDYINEGKPH